MKLSVLVFALCVAFFGCSKAPQETSEVEVRANDLLNRTFVVKGEYWFAVEETGSRTQLHQLRHPRSHLSQRDISETQRLNGITNLAVVYVICEHFRTWDGKWSEWRDGEGGGSKEIAVAFLGGLISHWSANLEQKNGIWNEPRNLSDRGFQQNRDLVVTLIRQSGQ